MDNYMPQAGGSPPGGVPVITVQPDPQEKKEIRKYYTITALIMLVDVFIFNFASRASAVVIGLATGSPVMEAYSAGRKIIASSEFMNILFSCGFPILAEIVSIALAVKFLGIDLKKKVTRTGFGVKEIIGGFSASMLGQSIAAMILMIIIMLLYDPSHIPQQIITTQKSFAVNVMMYFYVCLLGPVLEELLFRGVVLESIKKYNERFAIVFSALIFGLMHCNFTQAVNAFIIGLVLGAVYVRSDSIVPTCVLHILMNTFTSFSQVMIYSDPVLIEKMTAGDISALHGLPLAGLIFTAGLRLVTFPLGIIAIVLTAGKGFGLRKAAPAGKSRSYPLVLTNPAWILVILIYLVFCCINAF